MALFSIFIILLIKIVTAVAMPIAIIAVALHKLAGLSPGLSTAIATAALITWLRISLHLDRRKKRAALQSPPPPPPASPPPPPSPE